VGLEAQYATPMPCLALLAVVLAAAVACDRVVERQITRGLQRVRVELLESPDLHVVLCGTGSPLPDADRAGPCTAIVAGGALYLVDAGPGSWEVVDLAGLPTGRLAGVFLTHFHSDHIGDLGEAIVQSWIAGRPRPLDVFGPPGTAGVVEGFRRAYAADTDYRVAHHGDDALPRAAAGAAARETTLAAEPTASAIVLDRDGLRVTMFRVDHAPVEPAVGYRFEWRGRTVVVSGDTRRSASVLAHARGADILVHEALQPALILRVPPVARRLGLERVAKLAEDIPGYHTAPAEAAALARDAGVPHLVLTHLVPGPANFVARRAFLDGVRAAYDGEVTLGADGDEFRLAPRGAS
jgi:ribonuclease Z